MQNSTFFKYLRDQHWYVRRPRPAKFIIFNAKFLVFKTQFLVFNTKFLIINAQFLKFNDLIVTHLLLP